MIRSLKHSMRLASSVAFSLFLFTGAHADPVAVPVQNPAFADSTGDGMPDGWSAYPNGAGLSVAAEGGVWIKDDSTSKGLGIAQWVPVVEGMRYTVTAELAGEGGLFVYMNFLEEKPAQAKNIDRMTLKEKRKWSKGGGAESLATTFSEIAPAGAKLMRIWVYSPSSSTTNVRATGLSVTSEALEPATATAPAVESASGASSAGTAGPIQNPVFADTTGDSMPDGWSAYPGGDGLSVAEEGGVWIKDASTSKGLGIEQWVPVVEGVRYTLSLDLAGEGGLFAYMNFLEKKPNQAKKVSSMTLKEKRKWSKGGGATSATTTFSEIAPAGAKLMRIWIYSPSSGTTNVRATGISLKSESLGAPVVVSVPGAPIPEGCLTLNPSFSHLGVDQMPTDWEVYPAANDSGTKVAMTEAGLRLTDTDKKHGVGLSQWIPVEPGRRYVVNAEVEGAHGLFLYAIYTSEKPAQKSRYSKVEISQKRDWAKTGKVAQVSSVSPANAKWMRVWLYSASSGTADVVVKQITARVEDAGSDAAAVAAGLFNWMDFETGDMSQAASKEGGDREIVKKGEGPVREGNYAYRAMLLKSKERTELIGPRSKAYGVARYGWSIFVPEDFDADTFFSIITQWHDYGSGKQYIEDGGAPTHLYISKGDWRVKLRYQGEGNAIESTQFPLGSIEADRGQWTDWVMEVNWQAPGDGGWMKLYKNDECVIDYKGPTWYEGKDKGPYYKFGIYRGSNKWPGTAEQSKLVFDAFRMALGDDSTYDQVAPSAYSPRPE